MRAAEEVYPAGDPNAAPDFKGADEGELIRLPWKNGIKVKDRPQSQLFAPLQYLAMWQGLRGDDLSVDLDGEPVFVCSKTRRRVTFVRWETVEEAEEDDSVIAV